MQDQPKRFVPCPRCDGIGAVGTINVNAPSLRTSRECPRCRGAAEVEVTVGLHIGFVAGGGKKLHLLRPHLRDSESWSTVCGAETAARKASPLRDYIPGRPLSDQIDCKRCIAARKELDR